MSINSLTTTQPLNVLIIEWRPGHNEWPGELLVDIRWTMLEKIARWRVV